MQGHDALFLALAHHAQQALLEVDALQVEPAEFAHAKARPVEDLTDRAIERRPFILAPVLVKQVIELLAHDDLG